MPRLAADTLRRVIESHHGSAAGHGHTEQYGDGHLQRTCPFPDHHKNQSLPPLLSSKKIPIIDKLVIDFRCKVEAAASVLFHMICVLTHSARLLIGTESERWHRIFI